jgi:methylmalonyl-CoA mutase N-terminal domain/subunit
MARLRETRDSARVEVALTMLEAAARGQENLFPLLLECARAYCTLYEIRHAMEKVFGSYKEPVFF